MVVSETISQETVFLSVSLLLGVLLFFLYDILRIFRRIIPHGVIWIGIEDLVYWLICTGAVFVLLYQGNDGMVRGFAIGGIVIGMLFYYGLLSRFVIKINVFILKKLLAIIGKILRAIFGPFCWCAKKIAGFFRKRLKKLLKAIKISLCKL